MTDRVRSLLADGGPSGIRGWALSASDFPFVVAESIRGVRGALDLDALVEEKQFPVHRGLIIARAQPEEAALSAGSDERGVAVRVNVSEWSVTWNVAFIAPPGQSQSGEPWRRFVEELGEDEPTAR